jgi:hypothetical protein
MTKPLNISQELALPLDAVTQTFGVLAKRGSGKTYLGMVMAEEMIKAGLHIVAVDPLGVWWGLRSGADGTKPGLPVLILGGEHADVPIEPTSGAVIAEFVVENQVPAVIDLSLFRKKEAKQFMLAFAETLYHRNRAPIHVFLDEADEWAPQKPFKGDERLLGAIEDLIRRGRARGIGATLITQRSAVLNKDVLTQIEVLVTLRIVSPQDRAAIEEWVKVHGERELWQRMVASLAALPIGTAWIWSPGWLDIFEKIHVRRRETFDSSATPKTGAKATEPKALASVDTNALRERLADVIERHEADDPKTLRARIRELEADLVCRSDAQRVPWTEVPVFSDEQMATLKKFAEDFEDVWSTFGSQLGSQLKDLLNRLDATVRPFCEKLDELAWEMSSRPARVPQAKPPVAKLRNSASPRSAAGSDPDLGKPERAILTALAQNPDGCAKARLGILAGYSPTSGHFNNILGKLRSADLIDRGNPIQVLPRGIEALGDYEPLPTGAALQRYWLDKLGKAEGAILDALISAHPRALSKDELGASSGYSSTSGHFNNVLGKLRTLKLIEGYGAIKASGALFNT